MKQENFEQIISHPWFSRREAEYFRWYPRTLTAATNTAVSGTVSGIYVHIPFCDEICAFCPYNTILGNSEAIGLFVEALTNEIDIYSRSLEKNNLDFVYFGGGTPTHLDDDNLERILQKIDTCFGIDESTEISIETHPNHVNISRLRSLRRLGFNRISCGVQSFSQKTLNTLGCYHDAEASKRIVAELATEFANSGIDLLYRCNHQSVSDVVADIQEFIQQHPQLSHLSLYSLFLPDDSKQVEAVEEVEMAAAASELLEAAGYRHYASCASGGYDFSLAGAEGRYETDHWAAPQANYLGVGPGAFGFVDNSVTINVHSMKRYLASIAAQCLPIISLSPASSEEMQHRYFSLGVKTLEVPLSLYESLFLA